MNEDVVDREASLDHGLQRLSVQNLRVHYGGVIAVDNVTLSIPANCVVGLIGPNGAGKSSLVNAICGAVKTSSGRVLLEGQDITRDPAYRRAKKGVRRTFQNLELFDTFTVHETLAVSVLDGKGGKTVARKQGDGSQEIERIEKLLDLVRYRNMIVRDLPYGAKKMVELARAFIADPPLVILDEPVAGLDTREKKIVVEQIKQIAADTDSSVLVIEHDMATIRDLCDYVYVLDMGRLIAEGLFRDVVMEERVRNAYLGQDWKG